MVDDEEAAGWPPSRCPSWCTRTHREHDHPEDRVHQDDGVVVPVVLGRLDPARLRYVADPAELVVRRVREPPEGATAWVVVAETERAGPSLVLSDESARRLRSALPRDG